MENKKDFFSVLQVAKILGISRQAVHKKIKQGKIEAVRIGKFYAIPKSFIKGRGLKIKGKPLSGEEKARIEDIVDKVVEEYGEVLKKLGND